MQEEFYYKTLVVSESEMILDKCDDISKSTEVIFIKVPSIMDGLEYLIDYNIDSIIIDLLIGEEALLQFIEHINNDHANKSTPIIILSNIKDYDDLCTHLENFNIISIFSNINWNFQAANLLNLLKNQKSKIHFIQDSLFESEEQVTVDQLTGAYNRYGCEDIFHTLTSRFKAYNEPFCAIMLDIDHFKNVNDAHGHDVGDEVLKNFTNLIRSSIRNNDFLVRLGGEEFLIFMSNISIHTAIKNAERIRVEIESTVHSSKSLNITASFGVVEYKEDEEQEQLIKRSDELLYIAKSSGRNIVISENSKID